MWELGRIHCLCYIFFRNTDRKPVIRCFWTGWFGILITPMKLKKLAGKAFQAMIDAFVIRYDACGRLHQYAKTMWARNRLMQK